MAEANVEVNDREALRNTIAAAIDEQQKPAETPTETVKAEEPHEEVERTEGAEGAPETPEVKTRETLKLPAKEKADAKTEAKTSETETAKPAKIETKAIEAPVGWKGPAREQFKTLPNDIRKMIVDRDKEQAADYTRKMQEVSNLRRDADLTQEYAQVHEAFKPYAAAMQQSGFTPAKIIQSWMGVEQRLMNGEGATVLRDIGNAYKIQPQDLLKAYGIDPASLQGGQSQRQLEQPQIDPNLAAQIQPLIEPLRNQVADFQNWKRQAEEQAKNQQIHAQTTAYNSKMSEIDQFAKAVDESGNLLHPFFEEVGQQMAHYALAARQQGKPAPDLQALYDQAVWAHPETREKLIVAQREAAAEAERQAARTKSAQARKAGSSVTGAPGSGQSPSARLQNSNRSLRDTISAAVAAQSDSAA